MTEKAVDEGFDHDKWQKQIAELIDNSPFRHFPATLFSILSECVTLDAGMLVDERLGSRPELIADSAISPSLRPHIIDTYFSGAYLLDPFSLSSASGLEEGFYSLDSVAPDDFRQSEYYLTYYATAKLHDDCFFIATPNAHTRLSLAVGRHESKPRFSTDEVAVLSFLSPVIISTLKAFWRLNCMTNQNQQMHVDISINQAFEQFGQSVITDRERQVVHFILRGHSAKSVARELGISPGTVQMHRKNLYSKLNISSQSELFNLFIESLRSHT